MNHSAGRTVHKSERLMRILDILQHTSLTTSELRRRLELPENQTRSLQRDLKLLTESHDLERNAGGRYTRKDRKTQALNAAETLAMYSAARLLYHHAAEYNEHYLTAMEKLTSGLPGPVRRVTEQMTSLYSEKQGRTQSRSLEHCSMAWLESRWLKFDYHAASTGKSRTVELAIHFIEINPHNRAAYAIGRERTSSRPGMRVFKVSRMKNTLVLSDPCEIPDDFDPADLMQHAWGVSVGELKKLVLVFKPAARERLLEENLEGRADHVSLLPDGSTRVEMTVTNTLEVLPWIRGWGGWVRVEEPSELREQVIKDLQAGLDNYQPQTE